MFADVGDVAEIPGHQIVHLVKGCEGDVEGIGDELSMKNPSFDIALGQYRDLLSDLELLEWADQAEITGAMRFGNAFELPLDQKGTVNLIFGELVLPPTNGQIAAKRITVVEIRSRHRGFEIEADLHCRKSG